jgi:FAD synthase
MADGWHVVLGGIGGLRREHGRLLIAVGVFDGIHRGHAYLLAELRHAARRLRARPTVVTFDAHPDEILVGAAPPLVCDPEERLVRLARAGVAVTVGEHFDDALRRTPFDVFVAGIRARTELAGFLLTPDAAFGHERRGTPAALAELGAAVGFAVVVVPALDLGGRPVRSSEIRAAVAAGDLDAAEQLLGRPFAVAGRANRADAADLRSARLEFELPVALPPAGRYRAAAEPAWSSGMGPRGPLRRALAIIGPDGVVELAGRRQLPPGERLRVAFLERLD